MSANTRIHRQSRKHGPKSISKIIHKLKDQYYVENGSQRNIVEFFKTYVTIEDQIKLIKSFRANYTKAIDDFDAQDYFMLAIPDTIKEASGITKNLFKKWLCHTVLIGKNAP